MGMIFKIPGLVITVVGGFSGFFTCLAVVVDGLGVLGGLIAFFLLPFTIMFVPWYVALTNANWFLLVLVFGSMISGAILYGIGSVIDGD